MSSHAVMTRLLAILAFGRGRERGGSQQSGFEEYTHSNGRNLQ